MLVAHVRNLVTNAPAMRYLPIPPNTLAIEEAVFTIRVKKLRIDLSPPSTEPPIEIRIDLIISTTDLTNPCKALKKF